MNSYALEPYQPIKLIPNPDDQRTMLIRADVADTLSGLLLACDSTDGRQWLLTAAVSLGMVEKRAKNE